MNMWQSSMKRTISLLFGLVLAGGLTYCTYGYVTAESRLNALCAEISPGMSFRELEAFSARHGLRSPRNPSGVNYLVETRTFGRYGCRVLLEGGVVKKSEYTFAD